MITAKVMIEALQDEFDVRSYSGRAMYGAKCVGVDTDNIGDMMKVAVLLTEAGVDAEEVIELGNSVRTDSMGLGVIIYWPSIKLDGEDLEALEAKEEEEDEEYINNNFGTKGWA